MGRLTFHLSRTHQPSGPGDTPVKQEGPVHTWLPSHRQPPDPDPHLRKDPVRKMPFLRRGRSDPKTFGSSHALMRRQSRLRIT